MKILRLRAYCYPENVAASAMAEDIDAEYVRRGIVCINYTPMPSRGVSDEVRRKYKKIKYEEFHDGHVIVHRFPMIKEGTNIVQKTFKYLLSTIVEYFKGIRAKDIDLMLCSSTPPTQGMLTAMVAKRLSRRYGRKVPFVYNLQDIFPDSLVNTGMTRQGSLLWKLGRRMEDYIYRNADRIIVISEDFKRNIMAKGVPESKIVIVPNWADTDGIYPVERKDNVLFDRYDLERDKFYICYSGTIGHTQNMDLLLDVAKEIRDGLKDVRFVVIGDGAAKADVERRIKEENIGNVILLPFQPYEDIAHVFSLGDVGLIISKPGVGNNSVPSKTWSYMAAEKPVLASFDKDSALASLIEKTGCGIVAEAGSREELKEAIRKMAADSQIAGKGKSGKDYLMTELDKEKCVKRFVDTLVLAVE
ncbi:MAG: glycosyltransferase family 4 protein [Bacteroidaceae bacterium]|nr:glycosyltransferase family 4 protein [Bacteroidaceae bacterium]